MSEKREVDINYGEHQYKLVRIERVYEVKEGKAELIPESGDFILGLTGHNAGSWEAYKHDRRSFNTLDYQRRFLDENNYKQENGQPASDVYQQTQPAKADPTKPQVDPPQPRPTAPDTPAVAETPPPAPSPETRQIVSEMKLNPEQQAAVDLLMKDGVLEAIVERLVNRRYQELSDRITLLESQSEATKTRATETETKTVTDKDIKKPGVADKKDAATASTDTSEVTTETTTETPATAPTAPNPSRRAFRDDWFSRRWRQINGIPPRARYVEIDETTGRRAWVATGSDGTEVREYYSNRRGIGSLLAIGAAALGLFGIFHNHHELEELEHGKTPQVTKKVETKIPSEGTIVIGGKTFNVDTLERQKLNRILAEERDDKKRDEEIAQREKTIIKLLKQHDAKMTREHIHDHYHELRAIKGNEKGSSSYYSRGVNPNQGK